MGRRHRSGGGMSLPLDLIGHTLIGFIDTHKTEIGLNSHKCTLCGKCEKMCAKRAITVNKKTRLWRLYPNRCTHCLYCLSYCPTNALTLENRFKTKNINI